ncbi:conserved hypothetical protein [Thiomonas sp. X19]|jgi:hypothetical protein|uniref:plasmid mobilization protein n=1 Tax=Thiomonas sp. X19 TaxID=1050370 RepID=UPI000B6CD993|nr:hypothetical protein [Thiomonas sp. X19]SCC95172.1 conserved hypothetical protein [Thiomonas sp. X19]
MSKTMPFRIRLSPVEKQEIERIAKSLGMTISAYGRIAMLGRDVSQNPPPSTGGSGSESMDRAAMQTAELVDRVGMLESRLAEQEEAFLSLIEHLREQVRIPSFSEFRARYLADLPLDQDIPGSSDAEQLLHVARAYWKTYGQWPQATPMRQFGRLPKGMPPESWPTNPV